MITLEQLKSITNQKESILSPFVNSLNYTFNEFSINSPQRQAYFLSQICHESGCFLYTEEIASGVAYENRLDLGNTVSGDGIRFKGRGLIQLTGRNNYKKLSDRFGVNFVSNPYMLKSADWASRSAGWFWNLKKLNDYCDKNNFLMTTFLINGGFNGLEDRLKYLVKSYNVLEIPGLAKQMSEVSLEITFNIFSPKDSLFRKLLSKQIPDKDTLNGMMKRLQIL